MASIGEKEIREQIKKENFSNIYFIYGDEPYLKQYYVKRMKEIVVNKDFEAFNYHAYSGGDVPVSEILKDAYIVPLFGEYVFISVCDYPFSDRAEDCKKVCEFAKDLPESTIVVFWFDNVKVDVKKSARWRMLESAISITGSSVNLSKRSDNELVKMIISGCKKRNTMISPDNAKLLIMTSGKDIRVLMNETDKLSCYAASHGGEITKEIINKIATKCLEARVFDLSKAILKRDTSSAFSILDTLFLLKENPIGILSVIANGYIDIYRMKKALAANKDASEVAKKFGYRGREFVLRQAITNGRSLSTEQVRNSIDLVMDADNKLKSTSLEPRIILEETIIKLMMIVSGIKV